MDNRYGYPPSKKIKNFETLRTATIWAGLLGLAQALTWMALTIVGIVSYTCHINVDAKLSYGSLMKTIFLDLYFKGNCDPNIYPSYNNQILLSVPTVLSTEDVLIWDCVYLGVATFWAISSVLILACIKKDKLQLTVGLLYTWALITLCICLMDLALGIIFGIDYGRFNDAAYNYNLDSVNAGPILPNAVQLVAAAVVAMSMMIISFKGFILWLVNVTLMFYLTVLAISVQTEKNNNDTLFMPRKVSDEVVITRTPIKAYEEQIVTNSVYTNEAFVPDNRSAVTVELNQDPLIRAARMSTDGALHDHRFRNVDSFQQYPPSRANRSESSRLEQTNAQVAPTGAVNIFPAPDYSPPMSRSNQAQTQNGLLRNQRYQ